MKFNIEKLENGNYMVHVFKDGKIFIERCYEDLDDVVLLLREAL